MRLKNTNVGTLRFWPMRMLASFFKNQHAIFTAGGRRRLVTAGRVSRPGSSVHKAVTLCMVLYEPGSDRNLGSRMVVKSPGTYASVIESLDRATARGYRDRDRDGQPP